MTTITYRLTQMHWLAPSDSNPNRSYTVNAIVDGYGKDKILRAIDCNCPDSTYRRRKCRHQFNAESGKYGKPHATAVPIKTPSAREIVSNLYGE